MASRGFKRVLRSGRGLCFVHSFCLFTFLIVVQEWRVNNWPCTLHFRVRLSRNVPCVDCSYFPTNGRGGGGGLPYRKDMAARRKFWKYPLRGTKILFRRCEFFPPLEVPMLKWHIHWRNLSRLSTLAKKYCEIDRESSCCGTYYDEHIKRGVKPSVLTLERSDKHPRGYFTVLLNRGHRDGG